MRGRAVHIPDGRRERGDWRLFSMKARHWRQQRRQYHSAVPLCKECLAQVRDSWNRRIGSWPYGKPLRWIAPCYPPSGALCSGVSTSTGVNGVPRSRPASGREAVNSAGRRASTSLSGIRVAPEAMKTTAFVRCSTYGALDPGYSCLRLWSQIYDRLIEQQ